MKINNNVIAGIFGLNRNKKIVKGLTVKTGVKAGGDVPSDSDVRKAGGTQQD
jgi:hypothetical protein